MHNRNEVQPPISLPDLSAWHPVPAGATIPAGTPCAYVYEEGITVALEGYCRDLGYVDLAIPHYTELPISPPLPTEEGSTIVVASDAMILDILLVRAGECWFDRDGNEWPVETIRTWAPVTIGEVVVMP